MPKLTSRLTYANVASTLALVVAVGGGGAATAAALVAKNSVGSPQIINGAVKNADLANKSVTGAKVKDRSLTASDLADGTLTHAKFTTDPVGLVQGYAWNELATRTIGATSTLDNGYVYNSSGQPVSIDETSTGRYTVTFQGLDFYPGNVQVTSYCNSTNWCKVTSWGGGSGTAYVACYNSAGAPAESQFTVALIK